MIRLRRVFKYQDRLLDDPNPAWSENRVKEHYTSMFPEFINAYVSQGKVEGESIFFTIQTSVGGKG